MEISVRKINIMKKFLESNDENLIFEFEILLGLKSDYPDILSKKEMNFLSDRAEDEYAKGKTYSSEEMLDQIKKWKKK
ncbi:hypothetical protein [Aquiflexum lacus]|uniref:hypothetical protein n=1 Tax=Aquiflexum lacus TaxID=2483805 RepID=UPI001E3A34CF|nr:hypothetical protein [Aquiflexum lacus]